MTDLGPSRDIARVRRLLDDARTLTGARHVAIRCDTATLETVYLEREGESVVLHDRGETWFEIVQHPDRHGRWDEALVRQLATETRVEVRVERWNSDHGDVIGVRLVRPMGSGDRLADVLACFADLIESVIDHHAERADEPAEVDLRPAAAGVQGPAT